MITESYSLTGTPTLIYRTGAASHRIYLYTDNNAVYVGGASVTSANGMDIHKDTVTEIFMDEQETLYAATDTPGDTIIVLHPSNS